MIMTREEQINKEAYQYSQVVEEIAEDGAKYIAHFPEIEQGFKAGERWADAHPASHPIEERCSKERIGQMKNLYEKYYQSVAITLIEEGHTKEEIALIFFELGARAADENPL